MGKEILRFGDIENKKDKFYHCESTIFFKNISILRTHYYLTRLTRLLLVKKAINTLLVTCMMIIKLNHYIQSFHK